MTNDPIRQADIERGSQIWPKRHAAVPNEDGFTLPASGSERANSLSDARWSERLGRAARLSKREL